MRFLQWAAEIQYDSQKPGGLHEYVPLFSLIAGRRMHCGLNCRHGDLGGTVVHGDGESRDGVREQPHSGATSKGGISVRFRRATPLELHPDRSISEKRIVASR